MNKQFFSLLLLLLAPLCCVAQEDNASNKQCAEPFVSLTNFPQDKVMIVTHRGNWRQAPENSLLAFKAAVDEGANMVEIDIALTSDSVLILMHDKTVDRTTNGKGKVKDLTYAQISELYLKDGSNNVTFFKVPTLRETLEYCKGKVMINIDKGFDYIDLVLPMLEEYGIMDQVLFKGNAPYSEYIEKYGDIAHRIHFMPIVRVERLGKEKSEAFINEYMEQGNIYGFEITMGPEDGDLIDFAPIRAKGFRVWVNSLWDRISANHGDDRAYLDPTVYEWYLKKGVNIIQTDRTELLHTFLKKHNLVVK